MAALRGGSKPEDANAEIERLGYADVVGFPIGRALLESTSRSDLSQEIGSTARPMFVLQIDRRRELRAPLARLVEHVKDRGIAPDTRSILGEEAWWFPGTRWQEEAATARNDEIVSTTTAWFSTRLLATPA
jgi:hypothetical protein